MLSRVRLYNSLTRRVEDITPIEPGRIRMYTCGPTVYRPVHLGNLRSFVSLCKHAVEDKPDPLEYLAYVRATVK